MSTGPHTPPPPPSPGRAFRRVVGFVADLLRLTGLTIAAFLLVVIYQADSLQYLPCECDGSAQHTITFTYVGGQR